MALEIFYCNLTVQDGKKIKLIKECVYKNINGYYKGFKVIKVDIIKSLGFENTTKEYIELNKSDEKRNNITGAYE